MVTAVTRLSSRQFFGRSAVWRLCTSRWISDWGDAVHILAFNWLVVQQTGSAGAVGICQALWITGNLVGAWPGGWLVDRYGARFSILTSYALHALTIAVFALVALGGETGAVLFGGISLFLGLLGAPGDPAQRVLMQQVAADDQELARLNGLLSGGGAIAQCLGPLLAGWLLLLIPAGWAFLLNAVSFVLAALVLLRLQSVRSPLTATEQSRPTGSLFAQVRPLAGTIVATAGFLFGPAALLVLFLPYYVQQVQHWPPTALGLLEAARWGGLGLGTVIGSLCIARIRRLKLWIVLALAALGVPVLGFIAGGDAGTQALWLVILGTIAGFGYVCLNQLLLQQVSESWMGRVMGALSVFVGIGLLVAGGCWWLTIEQMGYAAAMRLALCLAAVSLIPAAAELLQSKYFSLDKQSRKPVR